MPRFSYECEDTFDCAVECGELTVDVPMFLKCFYPGDLVIENLMAMPLDALTERKARKEGITSFLTRKITERCDELIAKQEHDPAIWTEILLQATHTMSWQGHEMATMIAHDIALNITEFGETYPHKRTILRALSPAFQRKFIRNHGMGSVFVERAKRFNRMLKTELGKSAVKLNMKDSVNISFERLDDRMKAYSRLGYGTAPRQYVKPPPSKEKRKMLKQATRLANSIVGEHATYDFLRGKPVYVIGKEFVFKAEMRNPFSTGHGSTSICVCDHDLEPIADLCVYFQNSPALDHLAALKLHCDAGEDADIVYDGNVMRAYPRSKTHAAFLAVREVKRQDTEVATKLRAIQFQVQREERKRRLEAEQENQRIRVEAGGIEFELQVEDDNRCMTPDEYEAEVNPQPVEQIGTFMITNVVQGGIALSATTRYSRITDGLTITQGSWINVNTTNVTTATTGIMNVTGTSANNFVIHSNSTANGTMITWVVPQTPEQRKQNSKYARFRDNERSAKMGSRIRPGQKNRYFNKMMRRAVPGVEHAADRSEALTKWADKYSKTPQLRDSVTIELFNMMADQRFKLAYTLSGIARDKARAFETARDRRNYEDMLRDDDGNFPNEEGVPNLATDDEPWIDPAEIPNENHMRHHAVQLAAATVARTLTQTAARIRADAGEEPDADGDCQLAQELLERYVDPVAEFAPAL